ncbi:hypothetical protein D1646_04015 [Pseudoflavonifractor sp. 60]|uniref:hypothetical protein n=1 Tax=Pseudoflavonifractor sp. 60 TaxID=2304576 RepID=UPI00136A0481|nr:hypothetical protein [Pseudoflavonifractor sp. 60]NBI65989.1 hypothetical protein [Pseudoflavonifractor sp. 60]
MSRSVELVLWIDEYEMEALSAVLAEQGTTVEKRMRKALDELCVELVPVNVLQEIRIRRDEEDAAAKAEEEATRKYTAFCVRENEMESFFQMDSKEDILEVAKFLRRYLREEQGQGAAALQTSAFARMKPITAEQYDQLLALRMEEPGKVTGVFDLDFDKQEVSTVDAANGWKTWSMQDVSTAVYHAYRKSYLSAEQYMTRFLDRLNGKALTSAGHLSAWNISFAEEISEIGTLLNFYLPTYFNVDAVFGTHVRTGENDDTLNVYANYDMATGQVCDELEVDMHWADGREESVEYRLNAVEKATLLRKMDDYCQQQTGQTLAEYSAQRMAEMRETSGPMIPQM